MYCNNVEECFQQIVTYFGRESTGYALLLDTENIGVYSEILQRMEADKSKMCQFVSESCKYNELPDVDACLARISTEGDFVLVGSSQALMLRGEEELERYIDRLLEQPVSGHALIMLNYCRRYIEKFENRDPRIKNRTILVRGEESPIPQISLVKRDSLADNDTFDGIGRLLAYFEKMTESQLGNRRVFSVRTRYGKNFFSKAMYHVVEADGIYESLAKQFPEIARATEKSYGTDEQWRWLGEQLKQYGSLSAVVYSRLGTLLDFDYVLQDVMTDSDPDKKWFFWLAMKSFGVKNSYLKRVIKSSNSVQDLIEIVYMELADVGDLDSQFESLYIERKKILDKIPADLSLIAKYCEKIGKYEKNAVYYLTDNSEKEEYEFVKYLSIYDYSDEELDSAVRHFSRNLSMYLTPFVFDNTNTKVADSDANLRSILTEYFQEYKKQKLTNRIDPQFEKKVNECAVGRPYNKLRPRSTIIAQMDRNDGKLFFFDALGVEYLSFIKAKCEELGLIIDISVGHCELPSITSKNKEFVQYFAGECRKIDSLDELKHHSQYIDYQTTKEPIHLFRELEIIEEELRRIQSMLIQDIMKKAFIVSDHGASRLAVISGEINHSTIELDEKAGHSGRCCEIDVNPNIPYAAYEDGFAVLANYERFKGGRKANVEVHGGAALEEVIIPIITLSRKPENIEYCFTDPVIRLKQRDVAALILYCNVPMNKPRILVNGIFYEGEFMADKKHARFTMPELKRSRDYVADLYEGNASLSVSLDFKIQKSMGQEVDLLA